MAAAAGRENKAKEMIKRSESKHSTLTNLEAHIAKLENDHEKVSIYSLINVNLEIGEVQVKKTE